ncbi:hypothetical protein GYMLUDRAFT_326254 [Collybiopsis luxurians FD-317 M1]|nr:hypothetical protein GYMLUDRAFT_326254 [Collybiopsis luxurians FD-317 M1]
MDQKRLAALDTEILVIDVQLEALGRREGEIQRVLAEMRKMQDAVAAEKEALIAKRRRLEAQKQPIHQLPAEILLEIFSQLVRYTSDAVSIEDQRTLVNLSHTCSSWRALCLGTSRLWTFIHFPCTGWNENRVETFLERSGDAPLDIIFGGEGCFSHTIQCRPVTRKLTRFHDMLTENLHRLRYLSVECMAVDTAAVVVDLLLNSRKINRLPQLSSLSLAITREVAYSASFPGAQRPRSEFSGVAEQPNGVLKHLRLQRLPLLTLPPHFYTSLTTLEISFSQMPLPNSISLSDLIAILGVSRQLVHFSLSINLLATMQDPSIEPVLLPHLKQIDLDCGHAVVIPRLLSRIDAPALERIEIWLVPKSPSPSYFSENHNKLYLNLSSLKELSLQFLAQHDDQLYSSLRPLLFPALQKLEIVNTDPNVRSEAYAHLYLPPLPGFESLFRDPRFPLLTHLSLSHFEIGNANVETLLGYIPALTSLSLDKVTNCLSLLVSLALKAPRVAAGQSLGWMTELEGGKKSKEAQQPQRRMKFCPRLEALSFWNCGLDIAILWNMVEARNNPGHADADEGSTEKDSAVLPARRLIKPLRRTRFPLQASESGNKEQELSSSQSNSSSSLLQAMHASIVQPPSKISYLRLAGCKGVDEASAGKLGKWVKDVVWSER